MKRLRLKFGNGVVQTGELSKWAQEATSAGGINGSHARSQPLRCPKIPVLAFEPAHVAICKSNALGCTLCRSCSLDPAGFAHEGDPGARAVRQSQHRDSGSVERHNGCNHQHRPSTLPYRILGCCGDPSACGRLTVPLHLTDGSSARRAARICTIIVCYMKQRQVRAILESLTRQLLHPQRLELVAPRC